MLVLGCYFAATVHSSSHRGFKFDCHKSIYLGRATVLLSVSENAPCSGVKLLHTKNCNSQLGLLPLSLPHGRLLILQSPRSFSANSSWLCKDSFLIKNRWEKLLRALWNAKKQLTLGLVSFCCCCFFFLPPSRMWHVLEVTSTTSTALANEFAQ